MSTKIQVRDPEEAMGNIKIVQSEQAAILELLEVGLANLNTLEDLGSNIEKTKDTFRDAVNQFKKTCEAVDDSTTKFTAMIEDSKAIDSVQADF